MPANKFNITIAATDKATVVANKVASSLKRMIFPAQVAGKTVGMIGKDADFRRVSTGMRNIAREAVGVVDNVSLANTALKGAVGLAGAGAFITSAKDWAAGTAGAARFAQTIGMSSQKLQTLVGVGQGFGIEAQAMTGAVKTLGNTFEDALYGRNQDAMVMMNRLGISLHRTKEGAVDANRALDDVSDAIARNKGNPQVQQRIASLFGVSELLPMLRNGHTAFRQYEAAVARTGAVRSPAMEENAAKLQLAFVMAGKTLDGIGNRIENWIAPSLTKVLDGFTSLAEKHPAAATETVGAGSVVGTALGGFFGYKMVSSVARGVKSLLGMNTATKATEVAMERVANRAGPMLLTRIATLAEAVGLDGLAGAVMSLGIALEGLPLLAIGGAAAAAGGFAYMTYRDWNKLPKSSEGAGSPTKATGSQKGAIQRDVSYFTKQGWSPAQAAGIVANLFRESGLNSKASGDHGLAYGLAQWHPERAANFAAWAGHGLKDSTEQEQLAFVQYELTQGTERSAGAALRRAKTPEEAGATISHRYERPLDDGGSAASRAADARAIFDRLPSIASQPVHLEQLAPPAPTSPAQIEQLGAPTAPTSAVQIEQLAAPPAPASTSKIEVEFKNAPPGIRVTTVKPGTNPPAVKVAHAMPGTQQ
ncbi:MAG TPA: phage tail tip lysozyme [Rhizomicrobium sp.]|jgi:hypothetical protein